jgi:hypothetical protein
VLCRLSGRDGSLALFGFFQSRKWIFRDGRHD